MLSTKGDFKFLLEPKLTDKVNSYIFHNLLYAFHYHFILKVVIEGGLSKLLSYMPQVVFYHILERITKISGGNL